ncbi:MAG: serine/threonine protein kinase [Bdellovibrionales bacterium]
MLWSAIRFQLLELLGEGSQGCVYKALRRDRSSGLQQIVAVKILHSKTAVGLWRQEFESLSKVNSPYCVRVLSFERFTRRPALVLEYVEGVSLAQLGQTCWLAPEDVQEIIAQLEHALKDLHRQKIFHGDLSPQNVLIDIHGRVKVLDFGLANSGEKQTRVTPRFAAPERLNGEPSSVASDLFGLGKVEDFLLGFEKSDSPYLLQAPEERRFQDLSPCRERQRMLAVKIGSLLLKQKANAGAKTQTQTVQRQKPWSLKAFVLVTITSLMVLATSSATQSVHMKPMALLKLRTKKWHYFLLNGHPLGYSPISIPIEAEKSAHLQWISADGRGEVPLRLKALETLSLEDSDFSH